MNQITGRYDSDTFRFIWSANSAIIDPINPADYADWRLTIRRDNVSQWLSRKTLVLVLTESDKVEGLAALELNDGLIGLELTSVKGQAGFDTVYYTQMTDDEYQELMRFFEKRHGLRLTASLTRNLEECFRREAMRRGTVLSRTDNAILVDVQLPIWIKKSGEYYSANRMEFCRDKKSGKFTVRYSSIDAACISAADVEFLTKIKPKKF